MKRTLSAADVARLFGIAEEQVAALVKAGSLPGGERNGRVVVSTAELRRWLHRKNETALRTVAASD
jgi:hypothetical protein